MVSRPDRCPVVVIHQMCAPGSNSSVLLNISGNQNYDFKHQFLKKKNVLLKFFYTMICNSLTKITLKIFYFINSQDDINPKFSQGSRIFVEQLFNLNITSSVYNSFFILTFLVYFQLNIYYLKNALIYLNDAFLFREMP